MTVTGGINILACHCHAGTHAGVAISRCKMYYLLVALLSYTDKKVTKEPAWGGFEWIAPAIQATSPRPLQARTFVFAVFLFLF